MTDWEYIRETIRRATQASEEFQAAGEELINGQSVDDVEVLAERLHALQDELEALVRIMSAGSQVISDEFADAFTQIIYGERMKYRSSVKPSPRKSPPEVDD
jgi:hypothetical protein